LPSLAGAQLGVPELVAAHASAARHSTPRPTLVMQAPLRQNALLMHCALDVQLVKQPLEVEHE
jgi:hypothetical protein